MKSEPKDFMKVFLDLKNQIWDDCTKFTGISKEWTVDPGVWIRITPMEMKK